jgi:hypothetical protein
MYKEALDSMTSTSYTARALLLCLLAAYLIIAVFSALTLENHDYETEYLALGNLVVRGQLSLYADEMRGHWPPIPFYFYGAPQALLGPSLIVGRVQSVLLGALVLTLVWALATRWAGPVAGATAAALFCSHGYVIGYFASVHFAGLVALLHLLALYVLFCTEWPRRHLLAMTLVALLFLVKNNYWPTIPFMLGIILWRTPSFQDRLAVIAIAAVIPGIFFASDPRHLKMLAYVPGLQGWVEPLGYRPWYVLTEDAGALAKSGEYADIAWEFSVSGRLRGIAGGVFFLVKRYAIWLAVLAVVAALAAWRSRDWKAAARLWSPPGVALTFWLFWYLVACQFVVLGPYAKQAVGFVGAVAPLLAVAIGCLAAVVVTRGSPARPGRLAILTLIALGIVASPWIHRHHNLPRRVTLADTPVAVLPRVATRLAARLPAGETHVFLLGDPMALHLAGRRAYLQQFNQERWGFTSLRDPERYRRVGMWGPAELEGWLGVDARYAVLESAVVGFYRNRPLYRPILDRLDALIVQHFTLLEEIEARAGDRFLVYRRKDAPPGPPGSPIK